MSSESDPQAQLRTDLTEAAAGPLHRIHCGTHACNGDCRDDAAFAVSAGWHLLEAEIATLKSKANICCMTGEPHGV